MPHKDRRVARTQRGDPHDHVATVYPIPMRFWPPHPSPHRGAAVWRLALVVCGLASLQPVRLAAQTDYYNTDRGRPIRIEDAYPTERFALDAHLAPIRLERSRDGVYRWGIDPELAYGILPRTQLELGVPIAYTDVGAGRTRTGVAGVDLSLLYNFNVETTTLPALGVRASTLLPVGALGPDKAYTSVQGMATRTLSWARFHVNGEYTFGTAPARAVPVGAGTSGTAIGGDGGGVELARWLAGAAVDRTLPLRSMLVTGELFARQPIHTAQPVEWNAAAGLRYQLTPTIALDGGLGKRLTGDDRSWFVTFGVARVFGLPFFRPGL